MVWIINYLFHNIEERTFKVVYSIVFNYNLTPFLIILISLDWELNNYNYNYNIIMTYSYFASGIVL